MVNIAQQLVPPLLDAPKPLEQVRCEHCLHELVPGIVKSVEGMEIPGTRLVVEGVHLDRGVPQMRDDARHPSHRLRRCAADGRSAGSEPLFTAEGHQIDAPIRRRGRMEVPADHTLHDGAHVLEREPVVSFGRRDEFRSPGRPRRDCEEQQVVCGEDPALAPLHSFDRLDVVLVATQRNRLPERLSARIPDELTESVGEPELGFLVLLEDRHERLAVRGDATSGCAFEAGEHHATAEEPQGPEGRRCQRTHQRPAKNDVSWRPSVPGGSTRTKVSAGNRSRRTQTGRYLTSGGPAPCWER